MTRRSLPFTPLWRVLQVAGITAIAVLATGFSSAAAKTSRAVPAAMVTATARKPVSAPGQYVAVVSLRSRRHAELTSLFVPGNEPRVVHVFPKHPARLSFTLTVTGKSVVVRAISRGQAVRLSVALRPVPPVATTTTTPTPTTPTPPAVTPPPPPAPPGPPTDPDGLTPVPAYTNLFWQDAFNEGPAGSAASSNNWTYATPGSGCGDPAQSHATSSTANASLVAGGGLAITAIAQPGQSGSNAYTSAQLDSDGHFSTNHGTIAASIVLPAGQGLCSAFWMVGDNVRSESWPNYGEIDIVEALGNSDQTNRTYADIHGPVVPADPTGNDQEWENFWSWPWALTGVAHVYAINWTSSEITWTMDGVPYASASKASLAAGEPWLFDGSENFHLILDLAVGGWPGAASGWNTATMLVNWVRVYQ